MKRSKRAIALDVCVIFSICRESFQKFRTNVCPSTRRPPRDGGRAVVRDESVCSCGGLPRNDVTDGVVENCDVNVKFLSKIPRLNFRLR